MSLVAPFAKLGLVALHMGVNCRIGLPKYVLGLHSAAGPRPWVIAAGFHRDHPHASGIQAPTADICSAHVGFKDIRALRIGSDERIASGRVDEVGVVECG